MIADGEPSAQPGDAARAAPAGMFGGFPRIADYGFLSDRQVQALVATYHALWTLVEELTAVNLALLRGQHPGGRPGRWR